MPLGATQPKKLAVVEACSGIRSLMTLVTLAMIYAYFTRPKSGNKTYGVLRFVALVLAAVLSLPNAMSAQQPPRRCTSVVSSS